MMRWNSIYLSILVFGVVLTEQDDSCPPPRQVARLQTDSKGLGGYYALANSFLACITGDLPWREAKRAMDKGVDNSFIRALVKSQAAFISLVVLGLVFILAMPIVGLIFCCCRLCNRCGGRSYQKNHSETWCSVLLAAAAICFSLMLVGALLYTANAASFSREKLKTAALEMVEEAEELVLYVAQAIGQITCKLALLAQSLSSITKENLDKIPKDFGDQLAQHLLQELSSVKEIEKTSEDFRSSLITLDSDAKRLRIELGNAQKSQQEATVVNFLKTTNETIAELDDFIQRESGTLYLISNPHHISLTVQKRAKPQMAPIKSRVDSSRQEKINEVIHKLEEYNSTVGELLRNATNYIDDLVKQIFDLKKIPGMASEEKEKLLRTLRIIMLVFDYGLYVFIIPVLFIILLGLAGIFCGLGGRKHVHPTQRSPLSNCGGLTLMAAVGFFFIFSSLLMIFTTVIFLLGFVFHAPCHFLYDDTSMQIYGLADHALKPEWPVNKFNYTFKIKTAVGECKANEALYEAFQLDKVVSALLEQMEEMMREMKKNGEFEEAHKKMANETNVETQKELEDLLKTLKDMRASLNQAEKRLKLDVNGIERNLDKNLHSRAIQNLQRVKSSLELVKSALQKLKSVIEDSIKQTKAATVDMEDHLKKMAKGASDNFLDNPKKLQSELQEEIDHAASSVAPCRPLYSIWENFGIIFCQQLGDLIHGIWLGLGWCLVFFIPTIIFSVRLAKYFRKMDILYYGDLSPVGRRADLKPWSNRVTPSQSDAPPPYRQSAFRQDMLRPVPQSMRMYDGLDVDERF